MATIRPYTIQDGDDTYTVYIETRDDDTVIPPPATKYRDGSPDADESYGLNPSRGEREQLMQLREINQTIGNYARFVIGAFKGISGAEIQELNFKFGIKMGGKFGVPVLTECSTEGNFEIEVKCTFPKNNV